MLWNGAPIGKSVAAILVFLAGACVIIFSYMILLLLKGFCKVTFSSRVPCRAWIWPSPVNRKEHTATTSSSKMTTSPAGHHVIHPVLPSSLSASHPLASIHFFCFTLQGYSPALLSRLHTIAAPSLHLRLTLCPPSSETEWRVGSECLAVNAGILDQPDQIEMGQQPSHQSCSSSGLMSDHQSGSQWFSPVAALWSMENWPECHKPQHRFH